MCIKNAIFCTTFLIARLWSLHGSNFASIFNWDWPVLVWTSVHYALQIANAIFIELFKSTFVIRCNTCHMQYLPRCKTCPIIIHKLLPGLNFIKDCQYNYQTKPLLHMLSMQMCKLNLDQSNNKQAGCLFETLILQ